MKNQMVYSEDQNVPKMDVLAFKYPNMVATKPFYAWVDVILNEYDLTTDRDADKIRDKKAKRYFKLF